MVDYCWYFNAYMCKNIRIQVFGIIYFCNDLIGVIFLKNNFNL